MHIAPHHVNTSLYTHLHRVPNHDMTPLNTHTYSALYHYMTSLNTNLHCMFHTEQHVDATVTLVRLRRHLHGARTCRKRQPHATLAKHLL